MAESRLLENQSLRIASLSRRAPIPVGSTLRKLFLHANNSCVIVHIYCTANMAESEGFDPPCPKNGQPLFSKQAQYRALSTLQIWCG